VLENDGPTVPIVYPVSFGDPAGYFLATRVQMHNTKFTTSLNALLSPAVTATSVGINVETWRILSQTHLGGVVVDGGDAAGGGAAHSRAVAVA
jgi:hypothetical protein